MSTASIWTKVLAFVNRILPHAAVVGVALWYGNLLYEKGEAAAGKRMEKLQLENQRRNETLERNLKSYADVAAQKHHDRTSEIDRRTVEYRTTIVKESQSDPHLTNPDEGVSAPMLEAINKARAETGR